MPSKKVRYTQLLFGEANTARYLITVPGVDSVLIRQDGVACDVFADNAGTALANPVPIGVDPGDAGVSTAGELVLYLDPGNSYDGVATEGVRVTTFLIPDISPDVADVLDLTSDQTAGGDKTLTGAVIVKADAVHDVRGFTGWDPIAANNDAAYTAAIASASAAGGGDVLLPPLLKLATAPEITDSVNLKGRGSSQGGGGSVVELTTAGAAVKFGTPGVGTSGGLSRGFRVDGTSTAAVGLDIGCVVGRSFANIDVVDVTDVGLWLRASQNNDFREVNVQRAGNDCERVDMGAGSNHHGKCEYGNAGRYTLNIEATTNTGLPWGVQAMPLNNVWDGACIFEYDTDTQTAMIRVAGGFDHCIADSTIVAATCKTLIRLEQAGVASGASLHVRGGNLQFNAAHADNTVLDQSGVTIFYQEGVSSLIGVSTVGKYDGASIRAKWDRPLISGSATWAVMTGGALYYNLERVLSMGEPIVPSGAGVYTDRLPVQMPDGSFKWLHLYDS